MGSNQSGVIFGAIFVGFVIYITLKGELPIYAGLLLLSPPSSGGTQSATSGATVSTIVQGLAILGG